MSKTDRPVIACSLDAAGAADQLASWGELSPSAVRVQKTDHGARLWFEAAAASSVEAVAQREAECCSFLTFSLERDGAGIRLDITSEDPDGVAVAQLLADAVEPERSSSR